MIVRYIRHGACVGNEHSRATGGLYDHKLSENGIKEIKALVDSGIYPRYPGYCFTSQLSRAYDTLKLIYPNAQINKTDLLNERSFGEMEFMEDEEEYAYKKAINFDPWGSDLDFRFGGDGESLRQFYKRVKRDFCILLDEFNKNEYELVTICGHGAFLKGIQTVFTIENMPNPRFSLLKNGHGCIFEINKDDEEYHLKLNGVIGNGSVSEIFQTKEMELKFAYLKKK